MCGYFLWKLWHMKHLSILFFFKLIHWKPISYLYYNYMKHLGILQFNSMSPINLQYRAHMNFMPFTRFLYNGKIQGCHLLSVWQRNLSCVWFCKAIYASFRSFLFSFLHFFLEPSVYQVSTFYQILCFTKIKNSVLKNFLFYTKWWAL